MSFPVIAFLGACVFVTSMISGTFGMAGGMILMGIMLTILPVAVAMAVQSSVQLVSNGWRCFIWRHHIVWQVLPWYMTGIAIGFSVMLLLKYVPDKNMAFTMMGSLPLLSMLAGKHLHLRIDKPHHTVPVASLLTFVHMTAGVVGPLLDLLYINASLTRQQIIATKAFTQTVMHALRVGYFGLFLMLVTGESHWPEGLDILPMVFLLTASVAGTTAAAWILKNMNDKNFKRTGRALIVMISAYCLYQGIGGYIQR